VWLSGLYTTMTYLQTCKVTACRATVRAKSTKVCTDKHINTVGVVSVSSRSAVHGKIVPGTYVYKVGYSTIVQGPMYSVETWSDIF
jgi:hypothetical protein